MLSATILVLNNYGRWVQARAVLDSCSTTNLISEQCFKKLCLQSQPCVASIGSVNNQGTSSNAFTQIQFKSLYSNFKKQLSCLIVPIISEHEPRNVFPRNKIKIPSKINLADPEFHKPRPIEILICSGAAISLIQPGQINLNAIHSDLYLQQTKLGWSVVGGLGNEPSSRSFSCNLTDLQNSIERFWVIEEVGGKLELNSEAELCEAHYCLNTTRNSDGRYVVKLPFRHNKVELGDSRTQALRRFYSLHKKLENNPSLKIEYHKVMKEYIDLGHMSLVDDESEDGYYIPQHPVVKESSTTTKLRVVFDASAKTNTGISLNKVLMVGPTIQDKLFEHLLRFRTYKYVMIADIEKMYRQINVHPDDRKYQRIFWYHNNQISVFNLNTVTFGVASSPFLAIRTLQRLADDEAQTFPEASKILKRDVYVDDLLMGANTLEGILKLRDDIIELLKRGHFNIQKWASNHQHALDNIHEKIIGLDNVIEQKEVSKPLGIKWNSKLDKFLYTVKPIENNIKYTKRYILSEIAKIFDPLGLLGPIIVVAKLLMQECWKNTNDWDELIPLTLAKKWSALTQQLSEMKEISIPRALLISDSIEVQIHGFCDASIHGYGACIYVRSIDNNGKIMVNLACSKSRVTPLSKNEKYTIPRLELCGALVLTQLYQTSINVFTIPISQVYMWTDSTIVLNWLQKSPQTLKIFEANRVEKIQKLGPNVIWKHVQTHHNPADALSRGQFPKDFELNSSWFSGPDWLSKSDNFWPKSENIKAFEFTQTSSFLTNNTAKSFYINCSSYKKLINVIALIIRSLKRKSFKASIRDGPLTVSERHHAEIKLLSLIQREQFYTEIIQLQKSELIKGPKLSALTPFLDENGLIRVGGRLRKSNLPSNQKHPILLPSYHHVTDLIIAKTHLKNRHAGNSSTLFAIRQQFYLLDGKNQVRKIIRSCIECLRFKPTPIQAKMSDLPEARVCAAHFFQHVGVDYFGPVFIKEKKFRNTKTIKTYGCVFICMATKALHIEIASDLSTEGFLFAFRRFIGRRGIPSHVYSDNGLNFVGANNQLRELYALINSELFQRKISEFAVENKIKWQFNPPESPHFGGIWEAAVKSFKHHLKRVIGDKLLTYEEMYTLGVEIEAILNSRPLYALSVDPNDPLAITPGEILIGRPLTSLPDPDLSSIPANRLSVLQYITRTRQDFWRRWHLEYLSELQRRQKWTESKGFIKKGSIVVLMNRKQPCGRWPLGVITDIFPGDDGVTRVVNVKTSTGSYSRNVTNICPLPLKNIDL